MKTVLHVLMCMSVLVVTSFGQTEFSILIDPGHGGDDAGTVGYDGSGWPNEEDITLSLGNDLHYYLNVYGIINSLDIYMTRTADSSVTTTDRARMAKGEIADKYWRLLPRSGDGTKLGVELFLSVHCNSDGSTSYGTLGLIYDAVNDQTPSDRSSNDYLFSMNVVRSYVDSTKKVYSDASIRTSQYSPDGVGGRSNLPMLSLASVQNQDHRPCAVTILETEFASNNTTWTWLRNSNYQAAAVNGIAAGIRAAKNVVTGIGPPGSPPVPGDFRASVSGQDVVLSWTRPEDFWIWGHHVYKNGSLLASIGGDQTSYTDYNAVGGFPAEYYVGAWNGVGESTTDPIKIVGPATIAYSATWSGIVQVDGPVVINSEGSLTINEGTVVLMKSGAGITSSGRITTNGTIENPAVILPFSGNSPGSWGSIQLNGPWASGSVLSYVDLLYGTQIDVLNTSNITIRHCNIRDNSGHGINVSNSSYLTVSDNTIANSNVNHGILINGGYTNNCYRNVIYKTNHNRQGAGIQYGGANGTLEQNDIDYYNWGIAGIWGADIDGGYSSNNGRNNRVTNCQYGLMIYRQSNGEFGTMSNPGSGWNSIYNNVYYNAAVGMSYPTYSSLLYGEYNWWGANPPDANKFYTSPACTTYFWYPRSYDPWGTRPLPSAAQLVAAKEADASLSVSDACGPVADDEQDSLLIGAMLRHHSKRRQAGDFFMSFIRRHPGNQAAYVMLNSCADSETTPVIIDFFKSLPAQASREHKLLLANLYLRQRDVRSAKEVNNSIIKENINTPPGTRAKLNNFYIALYNDNDPQTAASILKDVKRKPGLSTEMELSTAEWALKSYVDPKSGKMPYSFSMYGNSKELEVQLPEEGGMIQNYPNPFNPTTAISYRLPVSGRVELKVYDILGREVVTLVSDYQEAGIHTAYFNGQNLASGVYFYRLTAPGISQVKKMLMVK